VRKVTETRGSSGGIFAVSCGSLRLYNRIEPRLEPHKCERGIRSSFETFVKVVFLLSEREVYLAVVETETVVSSCVR